MACRGRAHDPSSMVRLGVGGGHGGRGETSRSRFNDPHRGSGRGEAGEMLYNQCRVGGEGEPMRERGGVLNVGRRGGGRGREADGRWGGVLETHRSPRRRGGSYIRGGREIKHSHMSR